MSQTVVTASTGRTAGSRPSRRLRAEGQLPGVLYGLGGDSVPLEVSYKELRDALQTEAGLNTIFELDVEGTKETVLVRSIERDPISRNVLHADFLRIDTTKKITIKVPVQLVGEADLVAADGGMVEQKLFELEVEASPLNIPTVFEADQSVMTLSRSLTVGDLDLPEGVTTLVDDEQALASATITRASMMDEEEAAAAEAAAEAAEGEEGEEGEATEEGEASSEESTDSE